MLLQVNRLTGTDLGTKHLEVALHVLQILDTATAEAVRGRGPAPADGRSGGGRGGVVVRQSAPGVMLRRR